MTFLACLLLVAQQDQTAVRTEKGDYLQAVDKCKAAEAAIDSDPRSAVEKLDEILANPRLRKVECRLRIEEKPSEFTTWYLFLPYQYRGRARVNLASKAEPEAAVKLLSGAVDDLQESVKRGVAGSEAHLKKAQAELAKAKASAAAPKATDPPKEDPFPGVRRSILGLLELQKFKTARAAVDKDGAALTAEQRKGLAEEVDRASRDFMDEQVRRFRQRFSNDLGSLRDLKALTARDLEVLFRVPAPDEILAPEPVFDWARSQLPVFQEVRAGTTGGETLLAAAAAAASLVDQGENRYFKGVEALSFEAARESLRGAVDRSRDALRADRVRERAAADRILGSWKAFVARLDPKFLDRHPDVAAHTKELDQLPGEFPVEPAELEKVDLEACFRDADPLGALGRVIKDLGAFESRSNLARESRQKLFTLLAVARGLRLLADGKDEAGAARDLSGLQAPLRSAGGPGPEGARFGPRVAKILDLLR